MISESAVRDNEPLDSMSEISCHREITDVLDWQVRTVLEQCSINSTNSTK